MDNYKDLTERYPDDPALSYAIGVLDGSIISGEKIKQACKRHINDLRRLVKMMHSFISMIQNKLRKL